MASEPPQIGHEGWDLVHCDWELRQRDAVELRERTPSWWSRLATAVRGMCPRSGVKRPVNEPE